MSKVNANKKGFPGQSQQRTTNKGKHTKTKNRMKMRFVNNNPPVKEKKKTPQVLPPKDAQQFSTNWKALQEMLKASQAEDSQHGTRKQQNDTGQTAGAKEEPSKNASKNNVCPARAKPGKTALRTRGNVKGPAVTGTRQPSATKRKKEDKNKLNGEREAKKKQLEVEEKKLTEDDIWFDDVDPDDVEATVGAEAADIMRKKQGIQKHQDTESALVKERAFEGLTRCVAIDCEMVGVGLNGEDSILARVSIVNQFGKCIYDKYVKPTETVTDYRTAFSGIRPADIRHGENVKTVQREVAEILQGRIVVGHAIHNDFKILLLDHPKKKIRDTQKYKPFRKKVKSCRPSLKLLCREILNVKVQQGEHSSVQDAQATMRLYTLVKKEWEAEIKASQKNKDPNKKNKRKPKSPKNKNGCHKGL